MALRRGAVRVFEARSPKISATMGICERWCVHAKFECQTLDLFSFFVKGMRWAPRGSWYRASARGRDSVAQRCLSYHLEHTEIPSTVTFPSIAASHALPDEAQRTAWDVTTGKLTQVPCRRGRPG